MVYARIKSRGTEAVVVVVVDGNTPFIIFSLDALADENFLFLRRQTAAGGSLSPPPAPLRSSYVTSPRNICTKITSRKSLSLKGCTPYTSEEKPGRGSAVCAVFARGNGTWYRIVYIYIAQKKLELSLSFSFALFVFFVSKKKFRFRRRKMPS